MALRPYSTEKKLKSSDWMKYPITTEWDSLSRQPWVFQVVGNGLIVQFEKNIMSQLHCYQLKMQLVQGGYFFPFWV